MSLGQNIYSLRTAREMSQLELAETLGVSRQSISKWETDASIPELEKLIKLAQLFGVSLDELVKDDVNSVERDDPGASPDPSVGRDDPGASPDPSVGRDDPGAPHIEAKTQYIYVAPKRSTRKIVGTILLCMAFLCILFLGVLGEFIGGCIIAIPFIACGIICLCVKRLPGLWCSWAVYLSVSIYLQYGTGVNWAAALNILLWKSWGWSVQLIVALVLLAAMLALILATAYCLRFPHIDLRNNWKKLLVPVLVLVMLRLVLHFSYEHFYASMITADFSDSFTRTAALSLSAAYILLRTAILTALFTLASRCIGWKNL